MKDAKQRPFGVQVFEMKDKGGFKCIYRSNKHPRGKGLTYKVQFAQEAVVLTLLDYLKFMNRHKQGIKSDTYRELAGVARSILVDRKVFRVKK